MGARSVRSVLGVGVILAGLALMPVAQAETPQPGDRVSVTVSPTRFGFDPGLRSMHMLVENQGDLVEDVMSELDPWAVRHISLIPSSFTLAPGERQRVLVTVSRGQGEPISTDVSWVVSLPSENVGGLHFRGGVSSTLVFDQTAWIAQHSTPAPAATSPPTMLLLVLGLAVAAAAGGLFATRRKRRPRDRTLGFG